MEIVTFWATVGGMGILTLLIQRNNRTSKTADRVSRKEHARTYETLARFEYKLDEANNRTFHHGRQLDKLDMSVNRLRTDLNTHTDNHEKERQNET